MPTVGDRIYERRVELGLNQRDLGWQSGLTAAYISRVELGQRQPSVKALRKLAPPLDVSVYWLENGWEDPAEELARVVLDRDPFRSAVAAELARAVLRERRASDHDAPTSKTRPPTVGVRWTA